VTLVESMISVALTMAVSGAAFSMVAPMRGLVQAQPEAADMHQRLRVAVETLSSAIREAHEVTALGASDLQIAGDETRRYYLGAGDSTLRVADGPTNFPVVDHVAALTFELLDGADGAVRRVRVRMRVRAAPVSLRGRVLPDAETEFDVAIRR
jgi:hypothetical protein